MLHHVHVSLHGTTTVTSITTPGLSKMASGRVLFTVHNRTTAAQDVVLEAADDSTVLTYTAIPAGASKTQGFDATAQTYKLEYGVDDTMFSITALDPQTRYAPTNAKNTVIDAAVKAVGADITVTSPAGITDHASTHTTTYQWQSAPSPFGAGDFVNCAAAQAVYTSSMTGTNNDMDFTAVPVGYLGNDVTLTLVDPGGVTAALAVTVTGHDVSVSLARAASAITTTAAQLKTAIDGNAAAHALMTCANHSTDTGAGIVTALAKQTFTGGVSVTDPTRYTVQTADIGNKVILVTTATSPTEGSVTVLSNESGICTA